jgi:hypothetical protein
VSVRETAGITSDVAVGDRIKLGWNVDDGRLLPDTAIDRVNFFGADHA